MSRELTATDMALSAWKTFNVAYSGAAASADIAMEFFNKPAWIALVEALESLEGESFSVASLGEQLRSLYLSALGGAGEELPPVAKAVEVAWQAVGVHLHSLLNGAAEEDRLERLEASFAEWAAQRVA